MTLIPFPVNLVAMDGSELDVLLPVLKDKGYRWDAMRHELFIGRRCVGELCERKGKGADAFLEPEVLTRAGLAMPPAETLTMPWCAKKGYAQPSGDDDGGPVKEPRGLGRVAEYVPLGNDCGGGRRVVYKRRK